MVATGRPAFAPADANRVLPLDQNKRSDAAMPKLIGGGYFAFPDSLLAVPEKSDLVADSIMWNQGTSEILVAARSPLIGAATT
jgi:hypothetical protein